jgi:pseudouridine-5'-monophosphatase
MATSGLPAIRACLFDMDGLLIDSEDLYTLCTNAILREYGKPDLPWSIKAKLQGRPGPEASRVFQEWAQLPIPMSEFLAKSRALQESLFPNSKPLPGVESLLKTLETASTLGASRVEVALATSSHKYNFDLKTRHQQDIFTIFREEHRVLGDDPRIPPGRGKPAPDIYLLALQTLNDSLKAKGQAEIYPEECLVFEDSVPGIESGRRAGMQVVWCPHPGLLGEYAGREEEVLAGLTGEHKDDGSEDQQWLDEHAEWKKAGRSHARVRGQPGELKDGWGRYLKSLEDFPYDFYGIQ